VLILGTGEVKGLPAGMLLYLWDTNKLVRFAEASLCLLILFALFDLSAD